MTRDELEARCADLYSEQQEIEKGLRILHHAIDRVDAEGLYDAEEDEDIIVELRKALYIFGKRVEARKERLIEAEIELTKMEDAMYRAG